MVTPGVLDLGDLAGPCVPLDKAWGGDSDEKRADFDHPTEGCDSAGPHQRVAGDVYGMPRSFDLSPYRARVKAALADPFDVAVMGATLATQTASLCKTALGAPIPPVTDLQRRMVTPHMGHLKTPTAAALHAIEQQKAEAAAEQAEKTDATKPPPGLPMTDGAQQSAGFQAGSSGSQPGTGTQVGPGNSPSLHPITSYSGLGVPGTVNGNAAFGTRNNAFGGGAKTGSLNIKMFRGENANLVGASLAPGNAGQEFRGAVGAQMPSGGPRTGEPIPGMPVKAGECHAGPPNLDDRDKTSQLRGDFPSNETADSGKNSVQYLKKSSIADFYLPDAAPADEKAGAAHGVDGEGGYWANTGERCQHCFALHERGDDGRCNTCGKTHDHPDYLAKQASTFTQVLGFLSDKKQPKQAGLQAGMRPQKTQYDPICPHCDKPMYEKHWVPDRDDPKLARHRGDCYDKGPFEIVWPDQAERDAETKAALEYLGLGKTSAAATLSRGMQGLNASLAPTSFLSKESMSLIALLDRQAKQAGLVGDVLNHPVTPFIAQPVAGAGVSFLLNELLRRGAEFYTGAKVPKRQIKRERIMSVGMGAGMGLARAAAPYAAKAILESAGEKPALL